MVTERGVGVAGECECIDLRIVSVLLYLYVTLSVSVTSFFSVECGGGL